MSILDFTTGLFRDPANLRAFIDDPDQALDDAGLPGATPEQVRDLLPLVAESMPPDHPLQAVVHSVDPMRALAELDVDELVADLHQHHHQRPLVEKELGTDGCRPGDDLGDDDHVETIHVGQWHLVDEGDKALGDLFGAQIAEGTPEPVDHYPEDRLDDSPPAHEPSGDHVIAEGFVDTF
jgi:hypothetical protein